MAACTGCRKSEVLKLQWKNVDFERNNIYITNTKTGKNRFVPISQHLKAVLLDIKKNTKNTEYVFCDKEGKPLGRIETAWRAACRRAGIKDFRFHDLRHHYACTMVSDGLDFISLKQLLGHSSTEMLERYANFVPDKNKKAIDILNTQTANIWRIPKNDKG